MKKWFGSRRTKDSFSPRVEDLESRLVLDGGVSAYVSSSRLTIVGDEADNRIQVIPDGSRGVLISSIDGLTTVNGTTDPVRFDKIETIDFQMGAGNDYVSIAALKITDLFVDGGLGNDSIFVTGTTLRHTGTIWGNGGNDNIKLVGTVGHRMFNVDAGDGDDVVTVLQSHFGNKGEFAGGAGIDTLNGGDYAYGADFGVYEFENPDAPNTPVAVNDSATLDEGGELVLDIASNDLPGTADLDPKSIQIIGSVKHGSIVDNGNGTITYMHDSSETTADSFTYTISGKDGLTSNLATVNLSITPVNDLPVAYDGSTTVDEGASVLLNIAGNATDPENRLDMAGIAITTPPAHGSIAIHNDGSVTYTHDGSETTADEFKFTIKDLDGGVSNVATVTIAVTPVDDAPVAHADTANVNRFDNVTINLSGNDTDADSAVNPATIVIVTPPMQGSVKVNTDGTVTYTQSGSPATTDTFSYTIKDTEGTVSNVTTVNITINQQGEKALAPFEALIFLPQSDTPRHIITT